MPFESSLLSTGFSQPHFVQGRGRSQCHTKLSVFDRFNPAHTVARRTSKNAELYTYDDGDKLLTRGSTSYSYDECGRTKTIVGPSGTRTFTWDYEDRLTNLSGGGVSSTNYGYNGLGTRTSKSNSSGSRIYKRNGVGVTAPVLSDGVATMVPGISEKSSGVTSFPHTDRLGSMKGLSTSGALTDTADYDAFGKVVSRTGTSSTQKGFASGFGYQEDGESGYKLLGHRYYDAETGRFLSRDPAMDGRNWYGYCGNSPTKAIDVDGLKKKMVILLGDTHDLPLAALLTHLRDLYEDEYDIKIIRVSTEQQVEDAIVDADAVAMCGHGSPFCLAGNKGRTLKKSTLNRAARRRKEKSKGRLDFLLLFICNALLDDDDREAWSQLTKLLYGYEDECPFWTGWAMHYNEAGAGGHWYSPGITISGEGVRRRYTGGGSSTNVRLP